MRKLILFFFVTLGVVLAVLALVGGVIFVRIAGPSPSCTQAATGTPEPGTTSARRVQSGDLERCYLLDVPSSYDSAEPAPLVISLHGFSMNADLMRPMAGWHLVGEREGVVTVTADGAGFPLRWKSDDISLVEVDDVQFMRDLVADVSAIVSIDPARVYISGVSNGAGMSLVLACEAADLFAAVGVVEVGGVEADTVSACTPPRPVPFVAFEGIAADLFAPAVTTPTYLDAVDASTAGIFQIDPAPLTMRYPQVRAAFWAERNACAGEPAVLEDGGILRVHYGDCAANADVLLYLISGMGHEWPRMSFQPLAGESGEGLDAAAAMWAFFAEHPMPQE